MDRLKELLEMDQGKEIQSRAARSIEDYSDKEIEVYAFSIEHALKEASEALSTSIVNLEYEILEKGTPGFMGLGKKPYRILVRLSQNVHDYMPELSAEHIQFDDHHEIMQNQDGSFKLLVRKQGIMLKVVPPRGKGAPVSLDLVMRTIAGKQLQNVNQDLARKAVAAPNGKWVRLGDYIPSQFDSSFQVQIAPDEMKGFVTLIKPEKFGRVLEPEEIISGLKAKNAHFGFKEAAIEEAIENELYGIPILVAEGIYPQEGRDAEVKYHFKTSDDEVKFAMADDGSVDFHKLDVFQSVVVGQVLATKTIPEKGTPGKTVTGKVIPARDGKEIRLMPGKNTHLSNDNLQVIADINGQVVFKNGKINVEPVLEITGDVDLTTGDINFPGNVIIFGSVNDTFKVYSGGNIEVKGNIGKAEVVAEGNIVVRQGIQGKDEAKITCGGALYARFIERANLYIEGDIIISEVLLHSKVDCKSSILVTGGRRSQIAGGKVRALREINAKFLGAEAYTETILESGIDPEMEDRLVEMNKRKEEISTELGSMQAELNNLSKMMASGPLPPDKERRFNELSLKNSELKEEQNSLETQIEEAHTYLDGLGKDAKISASKITYPGVKIKIKSAVLVVKSEFKFVTFYKDAGTIKIVPYEKPKDAEDKVKDIQKRIKPTV